MWFYDALRIASELEEPIRIKLINEHSANGTRIEIDFNLLYDPVMLHLPDLLSDSWRLEIE